MRTRWILTSALLLALLATLLASCGSGKGTFPVRPGDDDSVAIQEAIDEAVAYGPGAVVQLAAGEYVLSRPLAATNLCGTVRGQGSDKTVLQVPPDSPLPLWTEPDGGSWGVVFGLVYDNSDPCELRFEGVTVDVAGQSAVRQDASGLDTGELEVFYLRGVGEPRPVSVAWRDVVVRGAVSDDFSGSSNNVSAAVRMAGITGTFAFSASTVETVGIAFVLGKTAGGSLTIGGETEEDRVTFADMRTALRAVDGLDEMQITLSRARASAITGRLLTLHGLNGCTVHVTDVDTDEGSLLEFGPCAEEITSDYGSHACASVASEITIENSIIRQPKDAKAAFVIADNEKASIVIQNNEIHSTGHWMEGPMYIDTTKDMIIRDNRFVGSGPAALYISVPMGDSQAGMQITGNDFSQWVTDGGPYEPDWHGYAPIWLGPQTAGITVANCGDPKVVVYDQTDSPATPEYDGKNVIEGLGGAAGG